MRRKSAFEGLSALITAFVVASPIAVHAQDATEPAATDAAVQEDVAGLTDEELQNLVAPVALYPDSVLIQILVAATVPLDVIKAESFLIDHADQEPAELEDEINAEGWDPSVAVLATAFPTVISQMASHVEWTESVGNAMLNQTDDVMNAVQVMRDLAVNSGALASSDEQTVEVEDDNVIITPTDPEVVYVPQYNSDEVYYGSSNSTGDILGTALITFGTIAVMDEIFDDDDHWNNYWGCRNCGGWGGGPIINDPDIKIDIDRGDINIGDINNRPGAGWKPDRDRPGVGGPGAGRPGAGRPGQPRSKFGDASNRARSDELRSQLSGRAGVADISRPGNANQRDKAKKQALNKTHKRSPAAKKPSVKRKPTASRAPSRKPQASAGRPKAHNQKSAMKKRSSGSRSHKASSRGKSRGGRGGGRGRR